MSPSTEPPARGELAALLNTNDTAGAGPLVSIVARTRRRSLQRLRVITGVSLVVALAGVGVAIGRGGTNASPSATSLITPQASKPTSNSSATKWTSKSQAAGSAPVGLSWSSTPSTGSNTNSSTPHAAVPSKGAALCPVSLCGESTPSGFDGPLAPLFTRTSGDVSIRAFTQSMSLPGSGVPAAQNTTSGNSGTGNSGTGNSGVLVSPNSPAPACTTTQQLIVEVANPGAVGNIAVPLSLTSEPTSIGTFEVLDSSAVGVAEGTPMEVLALHVAQNVSTVKASFANGGSDQMTVVQGWAVLVDDGASPLPVTVEAFDTAGAQIATTTVTSDNALAQPAQCLVPIRLLPLANTATPGTVTGST